MTDFAGRGRLPETGLLSALLSITALPVLRSGKCLVELEPPAGIEPATSRLQGECSGQLSYRGACVEVSIATDV